MLADGTASTEIPTKSQVKPELKHHDDSNEQTHDHFNTFLLPAHSLVLPTHPCRTF